MAKGVPIGYSSALTLSDMVRLICVIFSSLRIGSQIQRILRTIVLVVFPAFSFSAAPFFGGLISDGISVIFGLKNVFDLSKI